MAKRSSDNDSRLDKGKIRILYLEVDGNNESIQDALKTMVATMNKPVHVIGPARSSTSTTATLSNNLEDESPGIDPVQEPEVSGSAESEGKPAARKRGSGQKVDRNAGIELVVDLNFRPEGQQALRDFVNEKQPKTDMERVVVFVYYLERIMDIRQIGPGHVRTAFKDTGNPLPIDLKGTMRNMKRDKAWLKFDTLEDIKIATAGENFVEHDLPSTKA